MFLFSFVLSYFPVILLIPCFLLADFIYWCKWIISYFYVSTFRLSIKPRFDSFDVDAEGDPYKTDFLPFPEEITLESPLPESQLISTTDEVFFYGVNSKSEYLITRISRGTNQEAQAWIHLKLSNGKIYQLPQTSGFQQSSSDKRTFSCGGLQIHYLSPMRRWRIFFNGLLNETSEDGESSEKRVHVKFALLFRLPSVRFRGTIPQRMTLSQPNIVLVACISEIFRDLTIEKPSFNLKQNF
ncbi:hypothetical protein AVEN_149813-1 [Araneus ventricosus]|uniref:Uncharacterized protein n=1 Tax=Araneus ventricosus TaxID=182803 RepID=A0A4Y2U0U9_ARAVE|nr:hypothetical protein AVEN_149813-1 [Araneus ventricosus]